MLCTRVTTPGGTQTAITDAINGLRYSNVNPGGFESASFDISAALAPPKGSTLQISDEEGIAWEGRIEENDIAVQGDSDRRGIVAYGYGVLIKRTFLAMDFVQSDISKWTEMPLAQRATAVASNYNPEGAANHGGGIVTALPGLPWDTSHGLPFVEAWYRSPGIIYKVTADWAKSAEVEGVPATNPNFEWSIRLGTSDSLPGSGDDTSGDLQAAGPSSGTVTATAATRRYAVLRFLYGVAAAGGDNKDRSITWTNVKVWGYHSLTIRGTGADAGLYGGDIVNYLIGLVSGVNPGSIDQPTSWIVSQLALESRAGVEEHLIELNRQFGYDWGTWDSGNLFDPTPQFSWTAKQTTATWKMRRSDARHIDLGSSLDSMGDTVYVKYTDPSGNTQELTSTSSVRALTDAGMTGQSQTIDAGIQVAAGAANAASLFFSLQGQDPPLTGTIELAGRVNYLSGGSKGAHHMRANGALMRVEDLLPITEVYDLTDLRQTLLPIKRVEVDASGEFPITTLSIDQTQDALSVLAARTTSSDTAHGF